MYNHERYIKECLNSILLNNYPNKEILILDDGSTDNSYEMAQEWISENNKYFKCIKLWREENSGVAKTINKLINESSGDYIIPHASDDLLLPNGIQERIDFLMRNPEKLAVFGDCEVIDENSEKLSESALFDYRNSDSFGLLNESSLNKELLMRWVIPGPVLLLDRAAFFGGKGVGLYTELGGTEDRDYFLRLISRNLLGFIPLKVSKYRIHTLNTCRPVSTARKIEHYKGRFIAESSNASYFHGQDKLFLTISSMRYKYLIKKLNNSGLNSLFFYFIELFAGVLMIGLYRKEYIMRRFKFNSLKK